MAKTAAKATKKRAVPAGRRRPAPPEPSYTISSLAQLRALADPLRVRMLEVFCEQERTTKQVAEILGEKPTKLYHHVDALAEAGLIRRTRSRQKRGTVEKYYRAVALQFRADSELFSSAGKVEERQATLTSVVGTVLEQTTAELQALIAIGAAERCLNEEGILSFCEIRASPAEIGKIRRRLERLLKTLASNDDVAGLRGDERRFRLTVAYYPLDVDDDSGA